MSFFNRMVRGGRFTYLGTAVSFGLGVAVLAGTLVYALHPLVFLLGLCVSLGLIAVAAYEARATALGLPPPFTHDPFGWRAAKKSYDEVSKNNEGSN